MLAAQLPEGRRQHPLKLAGGTLTTGRRVDGPDSLEVVKHAAGMLLAHLRFRTSGYWQAVMCRQCVLQRRRGWYGCVVSEMAIRPNRCWCPGY